MIAPHRFTRNRAALIAGLAGLALLVLYFLAKTYLPEGRMGFSELPIIDLLLLFGMAVCLSIVAITHAFYAWTMSAQDLEEWFAEQMIFGADWFRAWNRAVKETYQETLPGFHIGIERWTMRLFWTLAVLLAIAWIILMLGAIFAYLFNS